MKAYTLYLCLAAIVGTCFSHTLHLGRTCPNVQPFPNLSLDKILGQWYVIYKFDTLNTCLMWNITRSATNSEQLEVTEARQLYFLDVVGIDHTHAVTAAADIPNPEVPGKLRIRWPTSLTGKADFIIFDTDYDKYAAIFQCDRAGVAHRRDVVLLSRTPDLDDIFVKRVRRLLDSSNVPHGDLSKIKHGTCRDSTKPDWHIKGEFFGLIPPTQSEQIREIASGIKDYDITDLEIIGEGVHQMSKNQKDNLKQAQELL